MSDGVSVIGRVSLGEVAKSAVQHIEGQRGMQFVYKVPASLSGKIRTLLMTEVGEDSFDSVFNENPAPRAAGVLFFVKPGLVKEVREKIEATITPR